jgi:phenylalanyl-tRNA synthetase alpha chain
MQEEVLNIKNQAMSQILSAKDAAELEQIRIDYLGRNGKLTNLIKKIKEAPEDQRKQIGLTINEVKKSIEELIAGQKNSFRQSAREWFDPTIPGIKPPIGHLHLVTTTIEEISQIFGRIGFERARYPEIEWDWFAFESLNMPKDL